MFSVANLEIENVIVASHLGKDIELIKLATELPNARYSSSGNHSVIIELDRSNPKFIGHKRLKAAGVLFGNGKVLVTCLLYTSPSPRDRTRSRMPSSA